MNLIDYLDEFVSQIEGQLVHDQERWGDTWKSRPLEGQADRIMSRYQDYYDQHKQGGQDMPWTKIAGLALIGYVREMYPDTYGDENEPEG